MDTDMDLRAALRRHTTPETRGRLRLAGKVIYSWWLHYATISSPAPGELILAATSTAWAALLWAPTRSFVPGTSFSALVSTLGSELALAVIMTVLAIFQIAGLLVDGWSQRLRSTTMFVVALWWAFTAFEGALTRLVSPSWTLAAALSWMAWLVWLRMRTELLHDQIRRQVHAESRASRRRSKRWPRNDPDP